MKKINIIAIIISLAILTALIVSAVNYDKSPKIEIDLLEYDFGKIRKQDGVISKNFEIKNSGSKKLIINDITTSCGCTSAKIDKKEISSGESAIIKVDFDPNFHEEPKGRFSRSVFIPTNDPKNPEIELKIFAEIIK